MIGSSQGRSWVRSIAGRPVTAVPVASRRWAQMRVGSRSGIPSLFQSSQREPSRSTNGLGSIDPPRSGWHITGCGAGSRNGPLAEGAVAAPMQGIFAVRWRAVK